MQRRVFLGLMMSSTALSTLALLSEAEAQTSPPSGNSGQGTSPGPAPAAPVATGPAATGTFMQDYLTGKPFTDSQGREAVYVAPDGTTNLYSPVFFNWQNAQPAIDHIYPSADSQTGWAVRRIVLPPEPPVGRATFLPTCVIVGDGQRTLLLFRHFSIQSVALGTDGSIPANPLITTIRKLPSFPMVSGQLPAGTRYIPEMIVDPSGIIRRIVLRDAITPSLTWPVDAKGIPTSKGWLFGARRQIFPLKQQIQNGYAFIALEETGDVTFVGLMKNAAGNAFTVKTRTTIGKSRSGCVDVREDTPGQIEVLMLEPPQVVSIRGRYDLAMNFSTDAQPNGQNESQSVTEFPPFDASTQFTMAGITNPVTGLAELYVSLSKSSGAAAVPAKLDLWLVSRRSPHDGGGWQPAVLLDRGARFISFFPGETVGFATHSPAAGFDIWRHIETEEFEQERIYVEADGTMIDSQVYRIGVDLGQNTAATAGVPITIRASTTAVAIVNGRHRVLGSNSTLQVLSNESGMVWINLPVTDRLYVPSVFISSPALALNLRLDPNETFRTFLGGVSADKLKAAKDPRTGRAVLPKPDNAQAVAEALRELARQGPAPMPLAANAPALTANIAAAWMPRGARMGEVEAAPISRGAFRLTAQDNGTVVIQTITSPIAAQHVRAMERSSIVPMLSWGDVGDAFKSGWDAVAGGVRKITEIVVDGLKVAVKMVIDGISYAYNLVIETIEHVFDAINWVLDAAGVLLGTALGWLLELLGFLFDWDAIKRRRDQVRDLVRSVATGAKDRFGDPKLALNRFSEQLQNARGTLADTLRRFESQRPNKTAFGTILANIPTLPALLSVGGNAVAESVLPQIMWIMDKANAVLPRARVNPGLPVIDKLSEHLGQLATAIYGAGAKFAGITQDLSSLAQTWISDERLFTASTFDPIVAIAIRRAMEILDGLAAIVDALGNVLRALWSNLGAMIDWYDKPMPKSFFGGFYRGLTGRAFSVFDLACLVAAIPYSPSVPAKAAGDNNSIRTAGGGAVVPMSNPVKEAENDLKQVASVLMGAHCVITGMNAFHTASTPKEGDKVETYVGYGLTALDAFLGWSSSLTIASYNRDDPRFWVSTVGHIGALLTAGVQAAEIRFFPRQGAPAPPGGSFYQVITDFKAYSALLNTVQTILSLTRLDFNVTVASLMLAVQDGLAVAVRNGKRPLQPWPQLALAYSGLQAGLAIGRTTLELAKPL